VETDFNIGGVAVAEPPYIVCEFVKAGIVAETVYKAGIGQVQFCAGVVVDAQVQIHFIAEKVTARKAGVDFYALSKRKNYSENYHQ
jgi:hypothetical protein